MKLIRPHTCFQLAVILTASGVHAQQSVRALDGVGAFFNTGIGEPRKGAAAAAMGGFIYISGGADTSSFPVATLEAYDIAAGTFTLRASMKVPRHKFGLAAMNGRIYAVGGAGAGGPLDSVEEYDPKSDRWRLRAPLNESRAGLSVGVLNGEIYAVGGWDGNKYSTTVEAYDPKANKWTRKKPLLVPVMTRDSLAVAKGLLYLVGGKNEAMFEQVQVYSPKHDAWGIESTIALHRNQMLSVAVVDDVIYAFSGDPARYLVHSLTSGLWSENYTHNTSFSDFSIAEADGTIYLGPPGSGTVGLRVFHARADFSNGLYVNRWADDVTPETVKRVRRRSNSDVDVSTRQKGARPDDYALIVGVENYRSLPSADYSEHDAEIFRDYAISILGVPKENVILLSGTQARLADMTKYLEEWLPRNSSPASRLYFYFSGHGAPDPVKGASYLIPWDGDPAFLASSGYPVSKLYEKLEATKAKEVIVALDACFSGEGGRSVIAKGLRPLVTVVDTPIASRSKISVLTAARSDEVAGSAEDQGHGLFTYYLLKGLRGDADVDKTGHITLGRLHSYIQKNVQSDARRQNRDQTPQVYSSSMGLMLH